MLIMRKKIYSYISILALLFLFNACEDSIELDPIDYVSFGQDEITFIEVKSGNSQLSSKQRKIRDQVKNGKIKWKEIDKAETR